MNILQLNEGFEASEYTYGAHARSYGPRVHQDLRLVYPYTGRADVRIDDIWYHVEAGQMIFLLPGTEEEYLFARDCDSSVGWCAVENPQPRERICEALAEVPAVHTCSERFVELAAMAESLYPTSSAAEREVHFALVQAMFCEFFRIAGYQEVQEPQMHPAVRRAMQVIDKRYADSLELPQIAVEAGVSAQHLVRLFKRDIKASPSSYLWRTRCEHAARMLLNTGFSASEIAYRCGFANPNHFSRMFKEYHDGVPPGAYRRNAWRGESG
ncbi:AraC family transcriptional regulator [Coraliomargarita akajimensis]|uniref:Transcriptional regulator, AraC family n=1 Tax=Coraliomargarita akajimensis (strain DSM 45221 / IAM 15411 / JCM 23193 / KCTC 12865 / 04OKA010-24) TaxID=583355 RepID=D5EN72_CORAD|nr:AraC family transcriptional regulator [Coraliomargarita akajimensis]ADE53507.1 transcriptional regulator, AraC family [Coraliomargarita akajimensis DSM 45221]